MESLVNLLPKSWQPKVKGIITLIGGLLAGAVILTPILPAPSALPILALTVFLNYQAPAVGYVGPEPTSGA